MPALPLDRPAGFLGVLPVVWMWTEGVARLVRQCGQGRRASGQRRAPLPQRADDPLSLFPMAQKRRA
jgi:hypothetical protein